MPRSSKVSTVHCNFLSSFYFFAGSINPQSRIRGWCVTVHSHARLRYFRVYRCRRLDHHSRFAIARQKGERIDVASASRTRELVSVGRESERMEIADKIQPTRHPRSTEIRRKVSLDVARTKKKDRTQPDPLSHPTQTRQFGRRRSIGQPPPILTKSSRTMRFYRRFLVAKHARRQSRLAGFIPTDEPTFRPTRSVKLRRHEMIFLISFRVLHTIVDLFLLFEPLIGKMSIQYANDEDGRERRRNYDVSFSHEAVNDMMDVFNKVNTGAGRTFKRA